jgi:hypothetical protein
MQAITIPFLDKADGHHARPHEAYARVQAGDQIPIPCGILAQDVPITPFLYTRRLTEARDS